MVEKTKSEVQAGYNLTNEFHFGYIIFDTKSIYLLNKTAKKLLNLSQSKTQPFVSITNIGFLNSQEEELFKKQCQAVLKSGKPIEFSFKLKGKKPAQIEVSVSTLRHDKKIVYRPL